MKLPSSLAALLGLASGAVAAVASAAQTPPALPLSTSSRWIVDANGARVKFRCINWAGHMEAGVPEGLNKQPVAYLADWVSAQGFNCVRLTYSIDRALDMGAPLADAFGSATAAAAGVPADSLAAVYAQVQQQNPGLATAGDAFGAVVDALWARGVMTVLDNHVSRGGWCCNLTDGNGWWDTAFGYNEWNSRYFHTADWLAGLKAMASWAASGDHPGVVAMSVRNEMRAFLLQDTNGRADWYSLVGQGAAALHAAHPDALVVIGGVNSATDLSHLRASPLDTSAWPGKTVWEFHAYSFTVTFPDLFGSCDLVRQEYGAFDGFLLEQGQPFTGPLFLSEFGVGMTGGDPAKQGLSDGDAAYLSCLVGYMEGNDADWSLWALQGSYYVREGTLDYDESYGALAHDWSGWRNPAFPGLLGSMWQVTQGP